MIDVIADFEFKVFGVMGEILNKIKKVIKGFPVESPYVIINQTTKINMHKEKMLEGRYEDKTGRTDCFCVKKRDTEI